MTTAGPDTLSGRHLLQIIIGRYYTALLYKGVENLVTTSTGTSDYSLTAEKSQYSEVNIDLLFFIKNIWKFKDVEISSHIINTEDSIS